MAILNRSTMEYIPYYMQNVGMALIAILIPIAIVLLNESEYKVLDYYSILEYVIDTKRIVFSFIFIFAPAFFWHLTSSCGERFLIFFFWAWGIILMFWILRNSYQWVKGDKYPLRFGYLERLTNPKDTVEAWQSIWESKETNSLNEERFTEIFIEGVGKNMGNGDLVPTVSKILDDYNTNIENRRVFSVLIRPNLFKSILEWHKKSWEKEISFRGEESDKNLQEWSIYEQLSRTLRSLLVSIENIAFDRSEFNLYILTLKKHIAENKELLRNSNGREWYYINELFNYFYPIFFEKVPLSSQKFDIFEHYLPKEWRVTSANWSSEVDRIYAVMTFNNFQQWAASRIWNGTDEWDKQLEDIMEAVFPETDPMTLAPILIYIHYSLDIRQVTEKVWNFGLTANLSSYNPLEGENGDEVFVEEMDKQRDETIKLSIKIFPQIFHIDRINDMVTEAQEIKEGYEEGSDNYRRTAKIEAIFRLFKTELEKS